MYYTAYFSTPYIKNNSVDFLGEILEDNIQSKGSFTGRQELKRSSAIGCRRKSIILGFRLFRLDEPRIFAQESLKFRFKEKLIAWQIWSLGSPEARNSQLDIFPIILYLWYTLKFSFLVPSIDIISIIQVPHCLIIIIPEIGSIDHLYSLFLVARCSLFLIPSSVLWA